MVAAKERKVKRKVNRGTLRMGIGGQPLDDNEGRGRDH